MAGEDHVNSVLCKQRFERGEVRALQIARHQRQRTRQNIRQDQIVFVPAQVTAAIAGCVQEPHPAAEGVASGMVPRDSHREKSDKDARELPKQVRQEIEKFFVATDELEAKTLKFLGWKGPKVGKRLIEDAAKSFKRGSAKPPDG
jgi:hypothetical protein